MPLHPLPTAPVPQPANGSLAEGTPSSGSLANAAAKSAEPSLQISFGGPGPALIFDHQMGMDCEAQILYGSGGRVVDGEWEPRNIRGCIVTTSERAGRSYFCQYPFKYLPHPPGNRPSLYDSDSQWSSTLSRTPSSSPWASEATSISLTSSNIMSFTTAFRAPVRRAVFS
ncbi:hypothetical protein BU15DRAFT_84264 [Melanogaster broomeanus]|nr:hypothetical protein BU15DRAFT_84264 [Melanogaster broomeanus]